MASRQLRVEIIGDSASLQRAFRQAGKGAFSFGNIVKGTLGFDAVNKGIDLLRDGLHAGIDEWKQSTKVSAQTAAVLKSTGGVAGVTKKQVDALAGSLLKKSGVDDETIKSGENVLLTFRRIRNETGKGNDVFNQATKATLDFSVAMGKDMKSSAILVGKALNDPIKGMTALGRAGVQLTDSQKATIKAMVEAGDTMGAQKIILAELNKEFGGSAKALGETLPGQINIAKETLKNFAGEGVGKAVEGITALIAVVKEHWPEIKDTIGPVMQGIRDVIAAVIADVTAIWDRWGDDIMKVVHAWVTVVKDEFRVVADVFKIFGDLLRGDWSKLWQDLKKLLGDALKLIIDLVKLAAQELLLAMKVLGGLALDGLRAGLSGLAALVRGAIHAGLDAIRGLWDDARSVAAKLGSAIVDGLKAGLRALGGALDALVRGPLNALISAWNGLGIPSFHVHIPVPLAPDIDFDTPSIGLPDIPHLAGGGIVTRPTLAMIGEAGPEAVIPLGRGGGSVVNVYVSGSVVSQGQLVDEIVAGVNKKVRDQGAVFRSGAVAT